MSLLRRRRPPLALLRALLVALLAPAAPLHAHPMPQSLVLLDFRGRVLGVELRLPADRLEIGYGRPLAGELGRAVAREHDALAAYVAARVAAASPDGRPWRVELVDLAAGEGAAAGEVVAHLRLTAPAGADARRLTLRYDVIQRELLTHRALVSLRSDWDAGWLDESPIVLGEIAYGHTSLDVAQPAGSAWAGLAGVARLGARHIAEGTDHLLFLLVLLLPAPLAVAAGGRRWGGATTVRHGVARLARIVTAFTVGHSLTLAAAAVGWLRAPAPPVEVLIALSILVSAVHAWRPRFPGREPWIAAGFGLVHGLAFATVVAGFGVDARHTALAILGFNVGIEAMQLAVVAATVPWLLLLARTRLYAPLRTVGALVAAVAALGWAGERALLLDDPVGPWVERAAAHGPSLLAALAALALASTAWERGRTAIPSFPPSFRRTV